ncbi:MAG: hypothetical protein K0S88_3974, partial [Actinomycetia bacterium]|nr:hypothetical protein [Actinomycetes bacterium]
TQAPYLVHDADPLALVADAWTRRFDEQGPAGELEVAVADTLARWRSRAIELPDYYLVPDAESLPTTRRHWYLGVLHRAAPTRVVPVPSVTDQVRSRIGRLTSGRWWPDLDRVLSDVDGSFPIRYHTLGRLERLPGWRECAEGDRRDLGAQRQPGSDGQEPPLRGEC